MTPSYNTPTTVTCRSRPRRGAGFACSALAAFFAFLLVLPATSAAAATATTVGSPRSVVGRRSAEPPHAIAHISVADKTEAEEAAETAAEAKAEAKAEAEEAAASAEAEAEEAAAEAAEAKAEARAAAEEAASGAQPRTDVVLSDLKLTRRTSTALRHRQLAASAVGFSFTLSAPATVSVTLVKQTNVEGNTRWVTLPNSLTLPAAKGQDRSSLKGEDRLSPGRYRLTVKPAGGHSRSIYLSASA